MDGDPGEQQESEMFVRLVRWLRGDKAAWGRALNGVRATRDMAQQTAITAGLAGHMELSKISTELGAQCVVFLVMFGALDPLRPDNDMSKINEQLEVIARLADQQYSLTK